MSFARTRKSSQLVVALLLLSCRREPGGEALHSSTARDGSQRAAPASPSKPVKPVKHEGNAMESLSKQLMDVGYNRLFLSDDSDLNRLWSTQNAPELFASVATDPGTPAQARFLAGEVLARRDPSSFPPKAGVEALAVSYAEALRTTDEANRWGMPGKLDERTGRNLVALGKAAVPALQSLLTDATPLVYGGSKEAMVGNAYKYRVKDASAFFIASILGRSFTVDKDPAARDRAIEELAGSLPK